MKLSTELSREQIINDLKHYYTEETFINKDNNDLLDFFVEHVKNNLQEVEIGEIFENNNINETFLVDTPDGIELMGEKIKKDMRECFTIITVDDQSISCSHDHKIETTYGWKYTKDLTLDDFILTRNGFRKIKIINKIEDQEVYDFEVLHDNHRYWGGSGISSHNTGKTYLSLITALHLMKTKPVYKRLLLVKSLTTIKGEEVGYLPGTLWEKMEPYMYSFTGNLDKIFFSRAATKSFIDKGIIEVVPIAYVRGITIDNSIVIIDETQNIDIHTFKTIITRIGTNSKMIFLGDIEQIDRKDKKDSCLKHVIDLFEDKNYVGTVKFNETECVRNPIIPKILDVLNNQS